MEERQFYVGVITMQDDSEITVADSEKRTFLDILEIAIDEQLPHVKGVRVFSLSGKPVPNFQWTVEVSAFFR